MLEMQLQSLGIQQDFLFELGGTDGVLGVKWLAGLKEYRKNFRD